MTKISRGTNTGTLQKRFRAEVATEACRAATVEFPEIAESSKFSADYLLVLLGRRREVQMS